VKAVLGMTIVAFASYSLIGRSPIELKRDHRGWLLLCGFVAGVLGGAYGMNGPPLVIDGAMQTLVSPAFPSQVAGIFSARQHHRHDWVLLAGLWTSAGIHYYLLSLPVTLVGVFLGRAINHRLRGESFLRYIYLGLAAISVLLFLQAITRRL
jgi:uncharacterized membrane protein YfcA